jgi:hypothetical protein
VPSENRVRRDDRRDFREYPAAKALSDDSETPTVVIIQPQPPPVQLRFQDPTRFSSRRNAMTSCCSRWSQPNKAVTITCSGSTHGVYDKAPSMQSPGHYGLRVKARISLIESER